MNNDEDTMEAIMSSFCARYLPGLISAYRSTHAINVYTRLLRLVAPIWLLCKIHADTSRCENVAAVSRATIARCGPSQMDTEYLLRVPYEFSRKRFALQKIWEDTDTVTGLLKFLLAYASHYPTNVDPLAEA